MLIRNRFLLGALAFAAVTLAPSSLLAAPHPGHDEEPTQLVFKVGKSGEVNIPTTVRIGISVLKKGKYLFQHLLEDGNHVFVFTAIAKHKKAEISEPAVIRVKSVNTLPRKKTSSSTLLAKEDQDHNWRILMIEVAGENMEHMF